MHKNLILAVGITILFLGLAVQPSLATVQLEKINITPDVEGLVAQLRVAINEKLEKYESIPKVAGFWDIIDYLLGLLENILKQFSTIVLYIFLFPFALIFFLFTLFLM